MIRFCCFFAVILCSWSCQKDYLISSSCQDGGPVVKKITNLRATIRGEYGTYYLQLERTLRVRMQFGEEDIHALMPCHLNMQFYKSGLTVVVSGEVLERNPLACYIGMTEFKLKSIRQH